MLRLLIGDPGSSWRDWVRDRSSAADLLVLDPTDGTFGPPARLYRLSHGRLAWERFYGSLDPQRSPHVLLAALSQNLSPDLDVLLFPYRPVPILRHTIALLAQLMRPDEILVSSKADLDLGGFPIGPEVVELPEAFPNLVRQAQRKAHWLKLLDCCTEQSVSLREVTVEGARLGTGAQLSRDQLVGLGLGEALYAERAGATFFVVADTDLEEGKLAHALDVTGASKVLATSPAKFENVHCSFARESGEDIGFGFVRKIDWEFGNVHCVCSAVPPVPVRVLRLGSLRVDAAANEVGELRPWEI
ncbi:MAG TPA: hypothetical protein VG944_21310 [Fimbriimonas sp.]|nr:hypothetical protein [Fimbriimonas sp.]